MSTSEKSFYVAGGTVGFKACYVERQADGDLYRALLQGEFCYVLNSRQMGKSSLMARTTYRLREGGVTVVALDLMALGVNLTAEQWYAGLLVKVATQLGFEDDLENYWQSQERLGPLHRFFRALREVVLPRMKRRLVVFIDEIDTVRMLSFPTDDFFAAMQVCYSSRTEESEWDRLTFCLLGISTPAELIRNPRSSPFVIGRRIELSDFTETEAAPLGHGLTSDEALAKTLLKRILHWTSGHPYLTQRFCQAVAEAKAGLAGSTSATSADTIDHLCAGLFFAPRARHDDPNLSFVGAWIVRTEADLTRLLELYQHVHRGERLGVEEDNDVMDQLRLSGIVKVIDGCLCVRNRIYDRIFDEDWISANLPDAILEKPNGERLKVKGGCTIGRASGNDVVLADSAASRRHALIQAQKQHQFWLMDLGSRNGTYVNGRRVNQPTLLRDRDTLEIAGFRLIFRQSRAAVSADEVSTTAGQTTLAQRSSEGSAGLTVEAGAGS